MNRVTHKIRLLAFLRANGSITSTDAIQTLGNTRLSATIKSLRDDGHNIVTVYECGRNCNGNVTRFGRYFLKEEDSKAV